MRNTIPGGTLLQLRGKADEELVGSFVGKLVIDPCIANLRVVEDKVVVRVIAEYLQGFNRRMRMLCENQTMASVWQYVLNTIRKPTLHMREVRMNSHKLTSSFRVVRRLACPTQLHDFTCVHESC